MSTSDSTVKQTKLLRTNRGAVAADEASDSSDLPNRPPAKRRVSRGFAFGQTVTSDERHVLIQSAAYCIAEQRRFAGDSSLDDWLQAERQVDELISDGRLGG